MTMLRKFSAIAARRAQAEADCCRAVRAACAVCDFNPGVQHECHNVCAMIQIGAFILTAT